MKFLAEIKHCTIITFDNVWIECNNYLNYNDLENIWCICIKDGNHKPYFTMRYSNQQRRDEIYKQLQDWMAEIYKCSINKYYLKIFADMGGDIIFRFPEE